MEEQEIEARIAELKAKYPASFSHPKAKPGEICVGVTATTLWGLNFRQAGIKSLRGEHVGDTAEVTVSSREGERRTERVSAITMFVNLRELVENEHKLRK